MTSDKLAEEAWMVRVTMAEAASESKILNFAVGLATAEEAVSAVKTYPGVEAEDQTEAGKRLSKQEIKALGLKHGSIQRCE